MRALIFIFLSGFLTGHAQVSSSAQRRNDIFIKVDLSKKDCFIGEPTVVTYALYTRLPSASKVLKRPTFKGFAVFDLQAPETGVSTTETINGQDYSVYLLRKAQLYPLQSGIFQLEPMEVENLITIDQRTIPLMLKTDPVMLNVKPLPAVVPNFNGAVGTFQINTVIHPKGPMKVGDLLELEIIFTGQGNFPMLNLPDVQWPMGIESYQHTVKAAYKRDTAPFSGSTSFIIPFMVREAGKKMIPSIHFSFFDPTKKTYLRIRSSPISLIIGPSAARIGSTEKSSPRSHYVLWSFLLMGVFVLLGSCLFFFKKRNRSKDNNTVLPTVERTWEDELRPKLAASIEENDAVRFYTLLQEGLDAYIRYRLGLDPLKWQYAVNEKAVPDEVIRLKEKATMYLYSPYKTAVNLKEDYTVFLELIH